MIVTDNGKHATVRMCALIVGVLDRIAGPIEARTLAIPNGKDAIDLAPGQEIEFGGVE